jgi:type I restriction enzyme R subunit
VLFRIFDAVDLYSALQPFTSMKPVVANTSIRFVQLVGELAQVKAESDKAEVIDEFVAKLQRKKRKLKQDALDQFDAAAGMSPDDLIRFLRTQGPNVAQRWFVEHAALAEVLDRAQGEGAQALLISNHEDELREVKLGLDGKAPGDYLEDFRKYVKERVNQLPALMVVTQRPRELTRAQLKALKLALDQAGYSEMRLRSAWRAQTNEDIAASIIGYIRQAALGDALKPYDERVHAALKKLLASQPWTPPQRKWLERIGKQLTKETVVDHEAIDSGQFEAEGGFPRLNKVFDGKLDKILGDLNEAIWEKTA